MESIYKFSIAIFFIYFFIGIFTLKDYGVSWDEPEHFMRGQAYLRFFLTGKATYEGLPKYDLAKARRDPNYHLRSYYQHDSYTANVWFTTDRGHPPLNDILAALFNYLFYQKLGWLGDIPAYHMFNIFVSSIVIMVVFLFAGENFGFWAGLFSAIFLATYPLFWGESHFNIKDPAQSSLFITSLYFFWKSVNYKKAFFIIISAIFAGLALSVKFNILFMPFILFPWLIIMSFCQKNLFFKWVTQKATIIRLFLFPIIMFAILIIVWPFLWQDLIGNLASVFLYYKQFGTENNFILNPINSWNIYALEWILYTTPPTMLLFFVIGILSTIFYWKKNSNVLILWLSLFFVTLARVSFPGTSIYGGVRQIMEYIPAVALISGVGAVFFINIAKKIIRKKTIISQIVIGIIILIFNIQILINLHPNENVYFNQLISGLSGAFNSRLASAGNSYGNAYYQAVQWLNKNSQKNSRVALIQGTSLNIPVNQLREDLDFSNNNWSAINRKGEYLIELNFQEKSKLYHYAWEYVLTFLEPVYEKKVDGVTIVSIWKNALEHTKQYLRKEEIKYNKPVDLKINGNQLLISLVSEKLLTRLRLKYKNDSNCKIGNAIVSISKDGNSFIPKEDMIPVQQVAENKIEQNYIYYYFAADQAKYIKIFSEKNNNCILKEPNVELYIVGN